MQLPSINTDRAKEVLVEFIRNEVNESPYDKCILGLSGGIDSTVLAYLTCEAVGSEKLIALLMPYKTSTSDVIEDARLVAQKLGIKKFEFDISPQIDAFKAHHPHDDPRRLGSKMVRERSALLYYYADMYEAVVLGTANKSEVLLGYFTKWGDPAADLLPLTELYKTHVLQLARALEVPAQVIDKPPGAGMWPGQKDEDEMGVRYADADPILYYLFDCGYSQKRIMEMGYDPILVDNVVARVQANEFKRQPQIKPTLSKEVFKPLK